MLNLVWVLLFFSIKWVYWLGQATLLICASAVSYINRDSSHPPKRMTEDCNELLSLSPSRHLSLSLTHIHTHTPVPYTQSVQFSRSVVSDSLRLHGLQHARRPCQSPTPGVHPNPCPSSRWYHPTISSSVVPFFSCPQSFPTSGSFQMSQLFTSGGQSTGVSASTSVLPMNTKDWFPLGWTGWISLLSKGLSRVFSNTTVQTVNSSALSFLYSPTLTSIHDHWKNHSLD